MEHGSISDYSDVRETIASPQNSLTGGLLLLVLLRTREGERGLWQRVTPKLPQPTCVAL